MRCGRTDHGSSMSTSVTLLELGHHSLISTNDVAFYMFSDRHLGRKKPRRSGAMGLRVADHPQNGLGAHGARPSRRMGIGFETASVILQHTEGTQPDRDGVAKKIIVAASDTNNARSSVSRPTAGASGFQPVRLDRPDF